MYNKGEYIIYGNNGVCRVQDYMQMESAEGVKTCYVLIPAGSKGSTIFSPVDNERVFKRRVISREEAEHLLEGIPEYEDMDIAEDRFQEQRYKEILHKCDCTDFLRFIKAIYARKKSREAVGKRITAMDEKYLSLAKDSLLNELSIALEMSTDEVDELLADRMIALESGA